MVVMNVMPTAVTSRLGGAVEPRDIRMTRSFLADHGDSVAAKQAVAAGVAQHMASNAAHYKRDMLIMVVVAVFTAANLIPVFLSKQDSSPSLPTFDSQTTGVVEDVEENVTRFNDMPDQVVCDFTYRYQVGDEEYVGRTQDPTEMFCHAEQGQQVVVSYDSANPFASTVFETDTRQERSPSWLMIGISLGLLALLVWQWLSRRRLKLFAANLASQVEGTPYDAAVVEPLTAQYLGGFKNAGEVLGEWIERRFGK